MVLFFTTTLLISIVAMVALLSIKRYELTTGSVLFAGMRPAVGNFFHRVLFWLEKILPALVILYAIKLGRALRSLFWYAIAQAVIAFEYMLERVLHVVREKTHPARAPGEASAFLREVADHKKKLLRRSKRTIVQE